MTELIICGLCRSLAERSQIDGRCKICKNLTCPNCKRICEKCQQICCMFHLETKIVMRQQKPFFHKLCPQCREVWL